VTALRRKSTLLPVQVKVGKCDVFITFMGVTRHHDGADRLHTESMGLFIEAFDKL
jgi:hypothetical protein